MRSYNLKIADYKIGFESDASGPELAPSDRFRRNICQDTETDLLILIHSGLPGFPPEAERVFHAPFVEEVNGIQIRHKTNFWSVWKHRADLYIKTILPRYPDENNAILKFSLTTKEWDLWLDGDNEAIDPFEYPLDGLILYYLTVIHGDIMIHASGINNLGHGFLFSGISGRGKTTMARLWDNTGAKVVHDDRLIIRNSSTGYRMYNTPVYNNDEPNSSPLNKIFIIEHGLNNNLVQVKGATAVSYVMANCIQHNWGHDIIARLLGSVSIMCNIIPVARLSFVPDRSVIDYILENE